MADTQPTPNPAQLAHEELRLLYTVSVADITFFKQQQWSVANYSCALYVAFVVTAKQFLGKTPDDWKLWVLCVLALAVASAGVGILCALQSSMALRRLRLRSIRAKFSSAFMAAWEKEKQADEVFKLLLAVIAFGAVFSSWLIYGERHL